MIEPWFLKQLPGDESERWPRWLDWLFIGFAVLVMVVLVAWFRLGAVGWDGTGTVVEVYDGEVSWVTVQDHNHHDHHLDIAPGLHCRVGDDWYGGDDGACQ